MKMDKMDKELLLHIIELQKYVIEGKDIQTIFRMHMMHDFRADTGANIIAICAKENKQIDFKYVLEEKRLFAKIIKDHFPDRKKLSWENFIKHCQLHFTENPDYIKIDNFHQVFNGFLSKKNSNNITKDMDMKETIIMPLYTKDNKERLGFVFYIFQSTSSQADLYKLKMATMLFQSLLQPLYDREHYTLYSKCVRVNNEMSLLTPQEKKIILKVFDGYSYPEVSEIMEVSINTVKSHMKNIFNKYTVTSKMELYNKIHETNRIYST